MRRRLESGVAKCAPVETPSRHTLRIGPHWTFGHENDAMRLEFMTSTLHSNGNVGGCQRHELLLVEAAIFDVSVSSPSRAPFLLAQRTSPSPQSY